MDVDKVREAAKLMRRAQEILAGGPLDYYLTEMAAAHDLLMTRYAPFKVGDRVRLKAAPEITENVRYGWLGWKSLLVAGAPGVVVHTNCGNRGFVFCVQFDADDTRSGKSWFAFSDGELEAF
jgi:hypothetical protein